MHHTVTHKFQTYVSRKKLKLQTKQFNGIAVQINEAALHPNVNLIASRMLKKGVVWLKVEYIFCNTPPIPLLKRHT